MIERRVSMDVRPLLGVRGTEVDGEFFLEVATEFGGEYRRIPGRYDSVDDMIEAIVMLQEAGRVMVGLSMIMIGEEYRNGELRMLGTYEEPDEVESTPTEGVDATEPSADSR